MIEDPGAIEATAGDAVEFTIRATRSPTLFTASGLPTGLSINADTGVVSGTPTQSGRFEVLVEVTNESGTGVYLHVLDIVPRPGAPIASALPIEKKAIEGTSLELSVQVEDGYYVSVVQGRECSFGRRFSFSAHRSNGFRARRVVFG